MTVRTVNIKKFINKIKEYGRSNVEYIRNDRDTIAKINLITLRKMAVLYFLAVIIYFAVSYFLLNITKTLPFFIAAFIEQTALCLFIEFYICRQKKPPYQIVQWTCSIFGFFIVSLAIPISTISYPDQPSVIFPGIIILMSLLYIYPLLRTLARISLYGLAFIIISYFVKDYDAFVLDTIGAVSAWVIAAIVNNGTFDIHKQDYVSRLRLLKLSTTDGLTGLLIKSEFERRSRETLDKHAEPATMFMIDIDNFKLFNDTFGHVAGDEILKNIARIILDTFGEGIVGRFGGDEFMALIDGADINNASSHADLLCKRIKKISPNGVSFISCSVGIVIKKEGSAHDCESMIAAADIALYKAKSNGKNTYQFA